MEYSKGNLECSSGEGGKGPRQGGERSSGGFLSSCVQLGVGKVFRQGGRGGCFEASETFRTSKSEINTGVLGGAVEAFVRGNSGELFDFSLVGEQPAHGGLLDISWLDEEPGKIRL